MSKRKNDDFEVPYEKKSTWKIINAKMEEIAAKAPFATFRPPVQYDFLLSAAKHKNILLAAAATRDLDAAMPLRSADTELQSTQDMQHIINRTHIAWMQQFHKVCQHMQNTQAQHHQKKRRSHLETSIPPCAQFEIHAATPAPAQTSLLFSAVEAPITRKKGMFPANPHIQIGSMT